MGDAEWTSSSGRTATYTHRQTDTHSHTCVRACTHTHTHTHTHTCMQFVLFTGCQRLLPRFSRGKAQKKFTLCAVVGKRVLNGFYVCFGTIYYNYYTSELLFFIHTLTFFIYTCASFVAHNSQILKFSSL